MGEIADQSLRDVEYTHRWYRVFLERLQSDGYRFRSFDDRLTDGDLVARHDVDLSVGAAVEMAHIEADLGVQSTYFLLVSSPLYNVFERETREQIAELEALGHDVGVHFSTHTYWPADEQPSDSDLLRAVRREQAALAAVANAPIETISFHIPPAWVLDREFPGLQHTYEPQFFSEIDYVADSSQRWRDQHPLADELGAHVQLLTHPGLWGETDAPFAARIEQAIAAACRDIGDLTRREFCVEGPVAVATTAEVSEESDV
ncbi:hypothetical protein [Halorarius litoreus]|uniref:hypothetical protein n=1 Tax=Halorarius litoreus TaxID=2962676 RepID=UPI0020CC2636|nr:hypothetical protein [Halorarius litoreus]